MQENHTMSDLQSTPKTTALHKTEARDSVSALKKIAANGHSGGARQDPCVGDDVGCSEESALALAEDDSDNTDEAALSPNGFSSQSLSLRSLHHEKTSPARDIEAFATTSGKAVNCSGEGPVSPLSGTPSKPKAQSGISTNGATTPSPASLSTRKRKRQARKSRNGALASPATKAIADAQWPIQDLDAIILSGLDERSYERALVTDSIRVQNDLLFPMAFSWNRTGAQGQKTLPYDIDDMLGITYAEDAGVVAGNGAFGYGKYETGEHRKGRSHHSETDRGLLDCSYDKVIAAARREEDKGQIGLTVTMPPPPSLQAVLLSSQTNHQHEEVAMSAESTRDIMALVEAERAETASCMPLYWAKKDKQNTFNPPAFIADGESSTDAYDAPCHDVNINFQKEKDWDRRRKQREVLVKSCRRKWKVSARVGNVSSRSVIFKQTRKKSSSATKGTVGAHKKIIRRPFLRTACLPSSVHSGRFVSTEAKAQKGAADKKYSGNKGKRITSGRTQRIWTQKVVDPNLPLTSRNRTYFSSFITGEKLESGAQKRSREMRVGVRLNGALLVEDVEDKPLVSSRCSSFDSEGVKASVGRRSYGRKTKQQDESVAAGPVSVPAFDGRSDVDISSAISLASTSRDTNIQPIPSTPNPSNAMCTLNRNALVSSMLKQSRGERKSPKRPTKKGKAEADSHDASIHLPDVVEMKHGASHALRHIRPGFDCLPLDDGLIRVVCTSPGSMHGSTVHHMLNLVAKKDFEAPMCSVCWTNEEELSDCTDCGMIAHRSCCFDQGETIYETNVAGTNTTPISDCVGDAVEEPFVGASKHQMKWRCAVCQASTKTMLASSVLDTASIASIATAKPKRSAKRPSRFNDSLECGAVPSSKLPDKKHRSSPKCTLCPHHGGAMSRLRVDNSRQSHRWTHEICRLWCGEATRIGTQSSNCKPLAMQKAFSFNFSQTCVLCGMGCTHNTGTRKEDNASDEISSPTGLHRGLVKCAAQGCLVTFHPMCATLASKLAGSSSDSSQKETLRSSETGATSKRRKVDKGKRVGSNTSATKQDNFLCSQYTLTFFQAEKTEGAIGSLPGKKLTFIVPIAFCGLHNPLREESLYGCPAGGEKLGAALRIPPL